MVLDAVRCCHLCELQVLILQSMNGVFPYPPRMKTQLCIRILASTVQPSSTKLFILPAIISWERPANERQGHRHGGNMGNSAQRPVC